MRSSLFLLLLCCDFWYRFSPIAMHQIGLYSCLFFEFPFFCLNFKELPTCLSLGWPILAWLFSFSKISIFFSREIHISSFPSKWIRHVFDRKQSELYNINIISFWILSSFNILFLPSSSFFFLPCAICHNFWCNVRCAFFLLKKSYPHVLRRDY